MQKQNNSTKVKCMFYRDLRCHSMYAKVDNKCDGINPPKDCIYGIEKEDLENVRKK